MNLLNRIKEIVLQTRGLTTIGISDIIGNAISAIFWFYMATVLGAEHYGEISYFLAISGIASAISLLGAQQTLTVYTAKEVKIQSPIYFISLISGTVASIVLFIIFHNSGVSAYTFALVLFGLAGSEILGLKLYSSYSKYLITQKLLTVVSSIGLYYILGPNGVILGMAISFLPYTIRIYKGFKETALNFSLIKPRFCFMMNSYILNLVGAFTGSIDKLIIAPLVGFILLGNYQLGWQFLSILLIFPGIVYKYTLPKDATGDSSKKIKKITILVSLILTFLGIFLSPLIIPVFFPKYTNALEVIQILSLSLIPSSINLMYISKLLGNEKSKIVLISQGINLSSWIISIIIFGKLFGINGVAIALVFSVSIETIFLMSIYRFMRKKA